MPLDISIDIFLVYFTSGYMHATAQILFFLPYFFLRNYYEQVCRCKSDLCAEHCKFEFMALLITHSIGNDVQPLLERDTAVLISNEKENNAIMRYI